MRKQEDLIWEDPACFRARETGTSSGLSLVQFFIGSGTRCPVMAACCPTELFRPGADLVRVLHLTAEDRRYLDRSLTPARVIRTRLGVGVLVKRFCLSTGMGLYIHVHAPAEALARIFNNRLLPGEYELSDEVEEAGCGMSASDEALLELIRPSWMGLMALAHGFPYADADGSVPMDDVITWIRSAAGAVGCGLEKIRVLDRPTPVQSLKLPADGDIPLFFPTRTQQKRCAADLDERIRMLSGGGSPSADKPPETGIGRVRWFGETMWEAYLLLCLLLARMYDPKRTISCELSTDDGRSDGFLDIGLSFSLVVPPEDASEDNARSHSGDLPPLPYAMTAGFDCLEQAMAYNGSVFSWSAGVPAAVPFDPSGAAYPVTCHLAFLHDPTLELESDIKEKIGLKYE